MTGTGPHFGYFRNSVFDARNFNDYDLNGNPYVPPFRMGQYGMTFGGPIKKDKTFFFLSYEGLRQLQSTTQQNTVPSGVCSGQSHRPPPCVRFQQYVLKTSPQMCPIMQAYPWRASAGTVNGCSPRFVYPDSAFQQTTSSNPNADLTHRCQPTTIHEDTWLVRMDHKFSEQTSLYGRAQRDISLVDAPNGGAFQQTSCRSSTILPITCWLLSTPSNQTSSTKPRCISIAHLSTIRSRVLFPSL